MKINISNNAEVQAFVESLRGKGFSLIIIDSFGARLRHHTALFAAADNVVEVSGGEVKFLKRRDA